MTSPGGPNHLLAQISPNLPHKTDHTHKNLNMPIETRSNRLETEEKLALTINAYEKINSKVSKLQPKNITFITKFYCVNYAVIIF